MTDILARLRQLTEHDEHCRVLALGHAPGYAPDDAHDHASFALRSLLIDPRDDDPTGGYGDLDDAIVLELRDLVVRLLELQTDASREAVTELALGFSLCPLHLHDYAICFDDDEPECEAIRAIHPGHDT